MFKNLLDLQTKVLFKNSSWVFVATFTRTGLLFVRSIILARTLGAELYGNYALVIAFVVTLQELFNLNIGTAIIKFGADFRGAQRVDKLVALIKVSFLISFVFALLAISTVYIASLFFYDVFFDMPGLESFLVFYAIAACMSFFDYIAASLLRLYYRFRTTSLIQIVATVIDLSFIATVAYLYPGDLKLIFAAVIGAMILNSVIVNTAALWEIRNELIPFKKTRIRAIKEDRREIVSFVIANSASRTLSTFVDKGDVLVLGAFSDAAQVGFYTLGKKLAFMINKLVRPLADTIYPQTSKLVAEGGFADLQVMLTRVTKLCGIVALFILFGGVLFREPVITALYGQEFSQAANPFVVHLITAITGGTFFWALFFILSIGKVNIRFIMNLIGLCAAAVTAFFLAPVYGAVGVAIALFVARSIPILTFANIARRYLKQRT